MKKEFNTFKGFFLLDQGKGIILPENCISFSIQEHNAYLITIFYYKEPEKKIEGVTLCAHMIARILIIYLFSKTARELK